MPEDSTLRHLAALYAAQEDPWGHLTRPYEREKYAATLEAVGVGPVALGLEIGCGIGAFSLLLAPLCRRLVALEAVPAAAARARARLAPLAQVEVLEAAAPAGLPDLAPDLVILSEVLYFLTPAEVEGVARWIDGHATQGARLVSVNWTGDTGERLGGREAADRLVAHLPGWSLSRGEREGYLLDVFTRAAPPASPGG